MSWVFTHLSSISILLSMFAVFLLPYSTSYDRFSPWLNSVLDFPPQSIATQSLFEENVEKKTISIPFETSYIDDPIQEIGMETVSEEGRNGIKEITTTTVFYDGKGYSRTSQEKIVLEAKNELIARGTKVVKRTLETEAGNLTYWKKLSHVWATSYDSTCLGCDSVTAAGMKQGYGVVAVDPEIIPLHTKLYIPGYGIAVAGDVGGTIKGKRIDLGYDSLNGQWKAHFVEVYFLVD